MPARTRVTSLLAVAAIAATATLLAVTGVVLAGQAAAGVKGDRLAVGASLAPGDSLRSPSGVFSLVLQGDGNLVEYAGGRALWTTATSGRGGSKLVLQGDGNLVLYGTKGAVVWAGYKFAPKPAALVLRDDGGLLTADTAGAEYWGVHPRGDRLAPGAVLTTGQTIWSPSTQYRLVLQGDGNLVLYTITDVAVWSTTTTGAMASLAMQTDGDLVLRRTDGRVAWRSSTAGRTGALLSVTDDASALVGVAPAVAWRTPVTVNTVWRNQVMRPGTVFTQGTARLIMQGDGNLVRYTGGTAVWSSRTASNGAYASMQADGNLVVRASSGTPLWSSGTSGTSSTFLRVSGAGLAYLGNASRVPTWIEGPPNWAGLARCESGGNPRAVNPAGYYGLYQFDLGTWKSNGGTGNPIDATPAVQTGVASTLYLARGRQPWPTCGKYL